ncbi:hypothetical protein MUK42_37809 [Musa troglodytarum]|uniref:Uncharacterized protein n=1 Tax=Musa troglodytarum TaxID=320322 RepID=A0A9E7EBN4_9LILI|nr:hypothetical protein MUK42_37809 [Musa troglodytarum]
MLTLVNFSPAPTTLVAAAVARACVHTVDRRTRGRFTLSVLTAAAARGLHRRLPVGPHRLLQPQSPAATGHVRSHLSALRRRALHLPLLL